MNIDIPLKDKIERRFGTKLGFYHKTKEDVIIVYKEDPYIHGPQILLMFDSTVDLFYFSGRKYSTREFDKVLDLLVFL
jgi:hypothetical protein